MCSLAQNQLSFTINQERKLFAKTDNRISVGGTLGVLNIEKVICSACDTTYTFGKNIVYLRPREQGKISVKFIVENLENKIDSLDYQFIVVPYPRPVLNLGTTQAKDTLKGIINRIWVHQDLSSPLTGIKYSISNLSVQIGDTIFKTKNKLIPKDCIHYIQLLKDTTRITISAHFKGPYGQEGNVSSSFVAPPFLPQYVGQSDSRCEGGLIELELYRYRYTLESNTNLYWIYSLERLKLDDLNQILNELEKTPNINTLENPHAIKIRTLD